MSDSKANLRNWMEDGRRTYAAKYLDKSVYEMAIERINRIYDLHDTVSVLFSGGKDSTVCLNLTLEVARARKRLPLDVVFYDEECIPPETVEYMARVAKNPDVTLRWFCIPMKYRNACSRKHPWWFPWAPEDRDRWVRPLPEGAITEVPGFSRVQHSECATFLYPKSVYGTVGIIFGIRTQESMRRLRSLTGRLEDNYITPNEAAPWCSNTKPIYDFKIEDVWTAAKHFNWDYNRAYDVMERAGIPRPAARCSPAFGEEPLQKLWAFAVCWPELWDKMLLRIPGVAAAGRYALTPLYGTNGTTFNTFDDPVEQVEDLIAKYDPKDQPFLRNKVRLLIQQHYAISSDPLPLTDVSKTGLSWQEIYRLICSGDFKNRRQKVKPSNPNKAKK